MAAWGCVDLVIDVPPGEDGKRRQMWRRGFKTEPEAKKAEKIAK